MTYIPTAQTCFHYCFSKKSWTCWFQQGMLIPVIIPYKSPVLPVFLHKLNKCKVWPHTQRRHTGEVAVQLHSSLTLEPDAGKWLNFLPSHITPRTAPVPTQKKKGWVPEPVCILKGKPLAPDRIWAPVHSVCSPVTIPATPPWFLHKVNI
jgi:hypothetical protein